MQPKDPNETYKGPNKIFRNVSLLMCYCSFKIGRFKTLKTKAERHAIELLLIVQISPDHYMNNTIRQGPFVNFTVISMEFPITNCLPFFFQADVNFYQLTLSHTLGRDPHESLIKTN